jgi:hypothetical protein
MYPLSKILSERIVEMKKEIEIKNKHISVKFTLKI